MDSHPLPSGEGPHQDAEQADTLNATGRVLVIDDDPEVRLLVRDLLAHMGWDVELATGAGVGIELMDRQRFDLVLTDLHMPTMDGWAVVDAARRQLAAVEVIILTGSAIHSDEERARRQEVTLLQKPVHFRSLKSAVEQALARRAARLTRQP